MTAARQSTVTLPGLRRMLRQLPRAASAELRDASMDVARKVAARASSTASGQGGVAGLVAGSIRARRDRVPVVQMGGSARLPLSGNGWERKSRRGGQQTVGEVIWGAEFGSVRWRQFEPWRGNDDGAGYFLWPTIRAMRATIEAEYSGALRDALYRI